MNAIVCSLIILCLLMSPQVSAIEVDDLYQASVSITDQSRQSRRSAQRDAFKKVLVKVSGNVSILSNPVVKKAISKADDYLRQFQFNRDEFDELFLLANFDEAKINRLLRQESLPIWGKRRPSILLWMAGENEKTAVRQVISKESYADLMVKIQKVSKDRGVPILFPLYDIEDNKKVSVSDVWGHFYQHIQTFSTRYNTDAIVISRFWYEPEQADPQTNGEAVDIDSGWKLQRRLYEADELVDVKTITGALDTIVEQLVHSMADRYAKEYAVSSSNLENAPRMVLTIRNVSEIANLIEAEKLLMSFSAVADVLLKTVNNDMAEFEIRLVGESLDLIQGMDLEAKFEKIYDPLADKSEIQPIEYRWVP